MHDTQADDDEAPAEADAVPAAQAVQTDGEKAPTVVEYDPALQFEQTVRPTALP